MKGCKSLKMLLGINGLGWLMLLASPVFAAGYKMEFQSAAVLADGGDAAVIDDASTNWYNSAGLVYLPQQFVASGIDVYAPTVFSGNTVAPTIFGGNFAASGSASSHPNSVLPGLHYALPLNEHFSFGISMVPAWGFKEDYDNDSILRYDLTRVYTKTIDIAPSLAWKMNDHWSIGLGPDFHYFSVESKSHARTQLLTRNDSVARFSADHWNYGGHIGVLYRYDDATRIGLNYRTKIVMGLDGYSSFILTGIGSYDTDDFTLSIPLPPTTTVSVYHDMTPCWALMGTIAFDQWDVLKDYHAENVQSIGVIIPSLVQQQNMHNTVDFSIGTHYKMNERWMLRGSIKYEPTPTINAFRDVNFPDGEKLGLNFGAHYQLNKKMGFDFIYGHVFVKTVAINGLNPLTQSLATGHSRTNIDLVGAQVVWNI